MLDTFIKFYFYELEHRESIFRRLQLNFAIYASMFAFIAYMIRMIDYKSDHMAIAIFFTLTFVGMFFLCKSIYYTWGAFTGSGLSYRLFPSTDKILEYRDKLEENKDEIIEYNQIHNTNEKIPETKLIISEYILEMLSKCTSFNRKINERRRIGNRKAIYNILLSCLMLLLSSFVFVAFDLDISSPRKEMLTKNQSLNTEISLLRAVGWPGQD